MIAGSARSPGAAASAAGQPPEISNSIYHGLHGLTRINARVEAEGRGAPLLPSHHSAFPSFCLPIILPPHFSRPPAGPSGSARRRRSVLWPHEGRCGWSPGPRVRAGPGGSGCRRRTPEDWWRNCGAGRATWRRYQRTASAHSSNCKASRGLTATCAFQNTRAASRHGGRPRPVLPRSNQSNSMA